jgi:F0F1-type ATP synthase assembly protein I
LYFKARKAQKISRPIVNQVLWVQFFVTLLLALLCTIFAQTIGASVLLGGIISLLGQTFYNYRALRHFGSRDPGAVISSTYSAMWGKWMIVVSGSLIAVMQIKELNAGALFASVFFVHTVGALLLPVLVKRVAL